MIYKTVSAIAVLLCWLPLTALGASVTTDLDGKVTGISGLSVDGSVYNLSFVGFGQSYDEVFAGSLDITTQSQAEDIIFEAVKVLNAAAVLNTDVAGNPVLSIDDDNNLLLPYLSRESTVLALELDWREPFAWRNLAVGPFPVGVSLSQADTAWIRVSQVPLPAAAWLFGSALFGLLALSRTRRER